MTRLSHKFQTSLKLRHCDKLVLIMKTEEILALFDREQRIKIEYPGVRKEKREKPSF